MGYAVFAVTLGTISGLVVGGTLPAMAITFVAFIVVQFVVPNMIRPHFMPPYKTVMPMTAEAINQARALGSIGGGAVVKGITLPAAPDAWISHTSELLTADGHPLSRHKFDECFNNAPKTGATGTFGDIAVCLGRLGLHLDVAYQPANRYWAFQWIETAFYLALSGLLTIFGGRRIRHRPG